jgi:hypothetical protein
MSNNETTPAAQHPPAVEKLAQPAPLRPLLTSAEI